jgi:hypothetical protein
MLLSAKVNASSFVVLQLSSVQNKSTVVVVDSLAYNQKKQSNKIQPVFHLCIWKFIKVVQEKDVTYQFFTLRLK